MLVQAGAGASWDWLGLAGTGAGCRWLVLSLVLEFLFLYINVENDHFRRLVICGKLAKMWIKPWITMWITGLMEADFGKFSTYLSCINIHSIHRNVEISRV